MLFLSKIILNLETMGEHVHTKDLFTFSIRSLKNKFNVRFAYFAIWCSGTVTAIRLEVGEKFLDYFRG